MTERPEWSSSVSSSLRIARTCPATYRSPDRLAEDRITRLVDRSTDRVTTFAVYSLHAYCDPIGSSCLSCLRPSEFARNLRKAEMTARKVRAEAPASNSVMDRPP
jgi:hypothetical protein